MMYKIESPERQIILLDANEESEASPRSFSLFLKENIHQINALQDTKDKQLSNKNKWATSSDVEKLIDDGIEVILSHPIERQTLYKPVEKDITKAKDGLRADFFDNEPPPEVIDQHTLDPYQRRKLRYISVFNNLKKQRQEEQTSLEERVIELKNDSLKSLVGYLKNSIKTFSDMAEFIRSSEPEVLDKLQPLLSLLAEKIPQGKYTFFDQIKNEALRGLIENPNPETISLYLNHILNPESEENLRLQESEVKDWINFVIIQARKIDPGMTQSDFANYLLIPQEWPPQLKSSYKTFVTEFTKGAIGEIKSHLPTTDQASKSPAASNRIEPANATKSIPDVKNGSIEKERLDVFIAKQVSKNSYSTTPITETDINTYIKRWADSIAPNDLAMRRDIEAILESLRLTPIDERITKTQVVKNLDGHKTKVYSLSPSRRPELKMSHPYSPQVRAWFSFIQNRNMKKLVIFGVGTHEDYEKFLRHKNTS